jgi:hypothetical protein
LRKGKHYSFIEKKKCQQSKMLIFAPSNNAGDVRIKFLEMERSFKIIKKIAVKNKVVEIWEILNKRYMKNIDTLPLSGETKKDFSLLRECTGKMLM